MVMIESIIEKFDKKGEKTGWTFVTISSTQANKIKPGTKKSFRVKGSIDSYKIKGVSLLPMGEGDFIMPLNAAMRKGIKKVVGEKVKLSLQEDADVKPISAELLLCLSDVPKANKIFNALPASHQRYYSNWIESGKTEETRSKRIAKTIRGLTEGLSFGETMKLDL